PLDRHTTLPIIIRCITTPIKRPTNTGDRSPKNQIIAIQDLAYPVRQTALLTIPSFVHRLYSLYINTSTDPLTDLPRQVKALDSEVRRREQEEGAQRKESASAEKVVGQGLGSPDSMTREIAPWTSAEYTALASHVKHHTRTDWLAVARGIERQTGMRYMASDCMARWLFKLSPESRAEKRKWMLVGGGSCALALLILELGVGMCMCHGS
ncbi:hypothetical protein BC938DRAFT_476119, partial [Jimgerdemannia flammicorona]